MIERRWDSLLAYLKTTAFSFRPDYFFSLYWLARNTTKRSTIVEIGCHRGDSTLCLALGAEETDSHVVSIDPVFRNGEIHVGDAHSEVGHMYTSTYPSVMDRLIQWGLAQRVTIIPEYSFNVLPTWGDTPLSLLVVDGEHTYDAIQKDCAWLAKIPTGGRAAFDDWFDIIEQSVKDYIRDRSEWCILHESTHGHLANGFNLTVLEKK